MVVVIFRIYLPPFEEELYKDIGKCSNFKAKVYGFFWLKIV